MQVILTEDEYHSLKEEANLARKDAKHQAALMAAEWVKKAVPVIQAYAVYGMNSLAEPDILKRLSAIKID